MTARGDIRDLLAGETEDDGEDVGLGDRVGRSPGGERNDRT
jgi:hypothetical protein